MAHTVKTLTTPIIPVYKNLTVEREMGVSLALGVLPKSTHTLAEYVRLPKPWMVGMIFPNKDNKNKIINNDNEHIA